MVLKKQAALQGCEIFFAKPEEGAVTQEGYRGQTLSLGGLKNLNICMAGAEKCG